MLRTLSRLTCLGLFALVGCDPQASEPEARTPSSDERGQRVGKADAFVGTCSDQGVCGGQSAGACWCDELCWFFGDCCSDAADACGVDECLPELGFGCPDGHACIEGAVNDCQAIDPCAPHDAAGVGLCKIFFGYSWNGIECVGLSGCECVGADCDKTVLDVQECEAAHAICEPVVCPDPDAPGVDYVSTDTDRCALIKFFCEEGVPFSSECGCGCEPGPAEPACGGLESLPCGVGEYCNFGPTCGTSGVTGVCEPQPDACTKEYAPVCGCNDMTYSNACMAAANGVSVVAPGPCVPVGGTCFGHCGSPSSDESCWCDDLCSVYGDCCSDKILACGS